VLVLVLVLLVLVRKLLLLVANVVRWRCPRVVAFASRRC
jgi:hypothetical protein